MAHQSVLAMNQGLPMVDWRHTEGVRQAYHSVIWMVLQGSRKQGPRRFKEIGAWTVYVPCVHCPSCKAFLKTPTPKRSQPLSKLETSKALRTYLAVGAWFRVDFHSRHTTFSKNQGFACTLGRFLRMRLPLLMMQYLTTFG